MLMCLDPRNALSFQASEHLANINFGKVDILRRLNEECKSQFVKDAFKNTFVLARATCRTTALFLTSLRPERLLLTPLEGIVWASYAVLLPRQHQQRRANRLGLVLPATWKKLKKVVLTNHMDRATPAWSCKVQLCALRLLR